MNYNVNKDFPEFNFTVSGASYAGKPRNNTIMYVTKKVGYLVDNLKGHSECLCFLEYGVSVSDEIVNCNGLVFCDNPQLEYARFASKFANWIKQEELKHPYVLNDGGYYIGENVTIGR